MKRVSKTLFKILLILVLLQVSSYLSLVIPRDNRIDMPVMLDSSLLGRHKLVYDFTSHLNDARISIPDTHNLLAEYPYKQEHPDQHTHSLNIHLSLGWFPLKTHHSNCIFVPAPSKIEFSLTLPENPVLDFDYGIISSAGSPALFKVVLVDEHNDSHTIFEETEIPVEAFGLESNDSFYKNFYKYIFPDIEDRDGRWNSTSVDLSGFSGQKVKIKFVTEGVGQGNPLAFWGQPAVYNTVDKQTEPNVLMIVIDSFRGDHLTPEFSPNLWRYAQKSVNFKNAFSNGNMTKLSVSSLFTSRYPVEISEIATHYDVTRENRNSFYSRKLPTLAGELKKRGYRTAAIGSCSLFCDGHGFSADLGFDEVINLEHSGYSPPHVTKEGVKWLKKHGRKKNFLLLYYDGPHGPYRPPFKYVWRSIKSGGLQKNFRKVLYLGEILYHDDYIGRLKEYLENLGLDENTIVVFTSDHGVTFRTNEYNWPTKYGAWKKKKVKFHSHGVSVQPEDVNVPLFVYDSRNQGEVDSPVELLDIAPTVLDLAGIKIPSGFRGRSIKPLINGRKLTDKPLTFHQGWQNRGIYLNSKWLYVENFAARNDFPKETIEPEELYNIKNDPLCRDNLVYQRPLNHSILSRVRRLIKLFVQDEEEVRIAFAGDPGQQAKVYIDDSVVKLKSGEQMSMNKIPHKVRASVDGKMIKPQQILFGGFALPVLESSRVKPDDREHIRGWPENIEDIEKPAIVIGIIKKDKAADEDLSNSSTHLRSMLEEWGYINQ